MITGQVNAAGAALAPAPTDGTFSTRASRSGVTVTVAGTEISSVTDSDGRFVLNGVPGGTVQLQFRGSGTSGTVTISGITPSDHIEIVVSMAGTGARIDSERRRKDNNRVEVNGRISARDVSARTFVVNGTTVRAPVGATIRHGSTTLSFGALAVGDHVQVKGTWDGAVLVAEEVKVEQDEDDEADDSPDDEFELKGGISGLSGTCPALTFTVATRTVRTLASTSFRDVTCAGLANGTVVEVKGQLQGDGAVLASKIERED